LRLIIILGVGVHCHYCHCHEGDNQLFHVSCYFGLLILVCLNSDAKV
jgi:hypothetical protein